MPSSYRVWTTVTPFCWITKIHYWQAAVCTERCSTSHHWHTQVRPRLVTLAACGVALAQHPGMQPVEAGSHSASLSAVQGSSVGHGQLLYTSLRHFQPTSFTVSHSIDITWPYHDSGSALLVVRPSLLRVWRSGTRYQTVSVTRRLAATASDNHWRRIYFNATTQHTQCSGDASWLCAIALCTSDIDSETAKFDPFAESKSINWLV